MSQDGLGDASLPEHLFVIGSPRSGTTWLQLLLARHPAVATDKETQLFTQYVKRLQERWDEEILEDQVATTNGLTRVLSEAEFEDAIRGFCDRVFQKLAEGKSSVRFVLEKSPEHGLHADTILRLYPDAWFLHIVRDPRSVSSSFRHASRKWWIWAPSGPVETTRRWRRNVEVARKIPELTPRYHEVRYEDLLEDGDSVLGGVFDWLELEWDVSLVRHALESCDIDRLKSGDDAAGQPWQVQNEPEGFFRRGRTDSWRSELSGRDVRIIEYEARGLLEPLGYSPETRAGERDRRPARVVLHDWLAGAYRAGRHLAQRLDWRMRRLLERM